MSLLHEMQVKAYTEGKNEGHEKWYTIPAKVGKMLWAEEDEALKNGRIVTNYVRQKEGVGE